MIAQKARKRVYASDYYVIPRRTGGRKRPSYLYDGRGSVAQTIQTNNGSFADAIRSSKAYSPFGELLSEKVSGYGFNGEYYDAATGMLNLRARQYEPAQGRFSQKDSEKGNVANARSLNAYLYCYNDGVNYFDASGAAPNLVRNVVMADSGGGGSAAKKQNSAPKTSSNFILSAKELSAAIAKGFSDPLWLQATGGGSAAQAAASKYNIKNSNGPTPPAANNSWWRGVCAAVAEVANWVSSLWSSLWSSCAPKNTPEPTPGPTPDSVTMTLPTILPTPVSTPPTVPLDQVDTWEQMRLRMIAEGLDNEAAKRIIFKASEMTHMLYDDEEFDCLDFVCDAYAKTDFDAQFRNRSTSRVYTDLVRKTEDWSAYFVNSNDLSNAEVGAVLFYSLPKCDCHRCSNKEGYVGNVHHVGIYIGMINGKETMVDNGTKGVSIRGVYEVLPHEEHGNYKLIAYLNPGGE